MDRTPFPHCSPCGSSCPEPRDPARALTCVHHAPGSAYDPALHPAPGSQSSNQQVPCPHTHRSGSCFNKNKKEGVGRPERETVRLRGGSTAVPRKGGQSRRAASSHASRPAPQTRDEERLCGFRFQGIVAHAAVRSCVKRSIRLRGGERGTSEWSPRVTRPLHFQHLSPGAALPSAEPGVPGVPGPVRRSLPEPRAQCPLGELNPVSHKAQRKNRLPFRN